MKIEYKPTFELYLEKFNTGLKFVLFEMLFRISYTHTQIQTGFRIQNLVLNVFLIDLGL